MMDETFLLTIAGLASLLWLFTGRFTMYRFFACLLSALAVLLVVQPTLAEEKEKTIKLFNGKDMEGWTYFLSDKKAKMEDVWSVEDGVIICKGKPAGYIRTKDSYKNYVLTLQWRFDPEKGPGNSGVLLRMVGQDKVWPKSVEAQLHSGNAGDFWNIDNVKMKVDESRTQGRRTVKLKPSNEKKLGEWNSYRIVVDHDKIQLYVNGELQNEATDVEEVAGPICLQSEGAEIHFRNIELKPIE
jgi:hypothetical protein